MRSQCWKLRSRSPRQPQDQAVPIRRRFVRIPSSIARSRQSIVFIDVASPLGEPGRAIVGTRPRGVERSGRSQPNSIVQARRASPSQVGLSQSEDPLLKSQVFRADGVAADQQAGVVAAEAEAVGHDVVDAGFAGDVGDVVEVAAFAGVVEVDGRGKDAGVDGQGRGDQLDAAGGAEQVAELALGAGDLEPLGVGAEDLLHGAGLGQVAERGAGAVGVDVVDGIGGELGVVEAELHGAGGAAAFLVGGGDVRAVGRHAVAEQLGVDPRPAAAGDLFGLEDQDAGPFGQDEAVAVAVERAAGAGRVVVAGRQGPHRGEPAQAHVGDRRLAAAGDHDVGLARLDELEGVADRVGRRGTGGRDRRARALQAPADRDLAAGGVDHQLGDRERADPRRALLHHHGVLGLELVQPADPRADDHAARLRRQRREVDPGIVDRRDARGHGELREPVEVPRFLDPEPGHRVPVVDLAAEMDLELGRVEQRQRPDAAPAGAEGGPEPLQAVAQRRDHPHAGDDDAAWMCHVTSDC